MTLATAGITASVGTGVYKYDEYVFKREGRAMNQDIEMHKSVGGAMTPDIAADFRMKRDQRVEACRIGPRLHHLANGVNNAVKSIFDSGRPR